MTDAFKNITFDDDIIYKSVLKDANAIFGVKDSLPKDIYILNNYKSKNGQYKINPKRKIRSKHGYLSKVKKLKPREAKIKVNVSKAAWRFILQQEIKEVQANKQLTQYEKDWISVDMDFLINTTDRKIIQYIRAGNKQTSIEFLDKKAHKDIRDKAETKFGPEAPKEVKDMFIYRSYKNAGNPLKYHNVSAPTNDAPQGLPSGEETYKLPRASDKDLQFKSFIQSCDYLDEDEKTDLLDFIDKIHIDYSEEV